MPRIEIFETPPGGAPDHIRQAWVGLILSLDDSEVNEDEVLLIGVNGAPPQNEGGYRVSVESALTALAKKDLAAAQWWVDYLNDALLLAPPWLVFHKDVCRLIKD